MIHRRDQTLCLLIPTFNRTYFLERLLRYLTKVGFPHPIIIADSSSASASEANRRVATSLRQGLDIHYASYSPETYPFSKIAHALDTIESKYSVMCADDDFIVPRAVEQCVRFLEANPDYAVAHGRTMSVYPVQVSHGISRLWTYCLPQRTIASDDASIRLREHLLSYRATFYSVHRRADLMRNMEITSKVTQDYRFAELLSSCLSLVQGKLSYLDSLYVVRPHNPTPESVENPDWSTLVTSSGFSQRYTEFRGCLAMELARIAGISITEANDVVNHAFVGYLTQALYEVYGGSVNKAKFSVLERAARRVWRAAGLLRAAANTVILDGQFITMARAPREFARLVSVERSYSAKRGYMSVDKLLDAGSPFHADFVPIYEHMKQNSARTW